MVNSNNYPSDITEATADFTKAQHIDNKVYRKAKTALLKAKPEQLSRAFLDYCLAVIGLRNDGALTIREACYEMGNCRNKEVVQDASLKPIILGAARLQRHPMNYKENHDKNWEELVKAISALHR